jgi:hypothetical protein
MPGPKSDPKRAAEKQEWDALVARLQREMTVFTRSRFEVGHVLYDMKVYLQKYGLNKGRAGKWQAVVTKYFRKDRKTAENYIRIYQEEAGIAPDKCVVAPVKKSQQNGKKNAVKDTALPDEESDAGAEITVADEDKKDDSTEGRMAVECVFVLTLQEKRLFMEAVRRHGSLRATHLMYQAVVSAE